MRGHQAHQARNIAIGGFLGIVVAAGWLLLAGSGSTSRSTSAVSVPTTRHIAEPVGATPSVSAQMICGLEAQKETAGLIGVKTTQPPAPTWIDAVYACRYAYPAGDMALSVKELSNRTETDAYFAALRGLIGSQKQLKGFGQGAFLAGNGNAVVVRKDYKVLVVDVSNLPAPFGAHAYTHSQVAQIVAATILGCWTGA